MATLASLLDERGTLLGDGAMGTELFARGLTAGDPPEMWNLDLPDDIVDIHKGYIKAGADIVLTNSFGGTAHRLELHHLAHRVHELNQAAAERARYAADASDRDIVVAVVAEGVDPDSVSVKDAMSFELVTASEDDDILRCVEFMREKGLRRLPIVDGNGALVGILTLDDVIDLLAAVPSVVYGLWAVLVLAPVLPGFYSDIHDVVAPIPVLNTLFSGDPVSGRSFMTAGLILAIRVCEQLRVMMDDHRRTRARGKNDRPFRGVQDIEGVGCHLHSRLDETDVEGRLAATRLSLRVLDITALTLQNCQGRPTHARRAGGCVPFPRYRCSSSRRAWTKATISPSWTSGRRSSSRSEIGRAHV